MTEALRSPSICGARACQPGMATPFAFGGNVVANTAVGFGPPETVTVGAVGFAVVLELVPVLPIENFCEEANMLPDVELRKRMK